MDRERIEKLAMDSAAGELNEDAQMLFRSYLAEHPEANEWALGMTSIYEMTEAAISAKTKAPAPPPTVEKTFPSPVNWLTAGRWAAVLAIAIFAGFSAGRWGRTAQTSPTTIVKIPEPPGTMAKAVDLKAKYAGTFWGQKVLASLQPKPRHIDANRRTRGDIWDIYRRRIKEKRNE